MRFEDIPVYYEEILIDLPVSFVRRLKQVMEGK